MTGVWLAAKTLSFSQLGGHLWAYLHWALGLRALGCRVTWLECVDPEEAVREVESKVLALKSRLAPYGLDQSVALCSWSGGSLPAATAGDCIRLDAAADADLLLNLQYGTHPEVVGRFRRSALVDIDPGQLQIWMSEGQIRVAPHDVYFSIGETVGRPDAQFPDCGLTWHYTPPPVFLPEWPPVVADSSAPYTTVSNWWGEWTVYQGELFNNEKRTSFLEYLQLPSHSPAGLELALCLGRDEDDEARVLTRSGWSIRHAWDVSATPQDYRTYVQRSRGEFSCAKPSCMRLQNAWVSDRTLCYLASGKPAVVQHTGPSQFLPDAEGVFRFRNLNEAVRALHSAEADYELHSRLARSLAEEYFDAHTVVGRVLERALA